jgi:nucleoside 2-deoxyribosyltransferase
MSEELTVCPLCSQKAKGECDGHEDEEKWTCKACGIFWKQEYGLRDIDKEDYYKISGWTRYHSDRGEEVKLIGGKAQELVDSMPVPMTRQAKKERVLQFIASETEDKPYGKRMDIDIPRQYTLLWLHNTAEMAEIMYALVRDGLVDGSLLGNADAGSTRLTDAGWDFVEGRKIGASNQAFVAMSFCDRLDPVYIKGIKPALESKKLRLDSRRMKEHHHNGDINYQIISEIRRSRLVVADFTGQRGGVYLEAGFALGLGIPVIWTCQDDEEERKKIHFDVEHYNFVFWENPEDLRKKLIDRIAATVPLPKKQT